MKKHFIPIIGSLVLLFCACHSEQQDTQQTENQVVEEKSDTPTADAAFTPDEPTGEIIVITEEEFRQRVANYDEAKGYQYKGTHPAIVDFYADWCRPCHALTPALVDLAQKYKDDVIIYKLNVDRAPDVCTAFEISSIPTLIFFCPGKQAVKMVGNNPKADIEEAIHNLLLSE